jgi:hypothetical protein
MSIDIAAATAFMAGHARLLDRRRFELLTDPGAAGATTAALEAYRNPDGGYGYGLEPDLRSPESQIGAAGHAFEALAEVAPTTISRRGVELCDWLASVSLPDGGVPFALPVTDPAACAPFWAGADPSVSSLQITAFVAGHAHELARHDPAVAEHPWLERATDYCFDAIRRLDDAPFALVLQFAVNLLDVAYETRPEAADLLDTLARFIPPDGRVPVAGGADGETIRALGLAPLPDRPARELFGKDVIDAELEQLVNQQEEDGGWRVDFDSYSPAAGLEWRGYITVGSLRLLRANAALR